jgi:hypothetical protein
MNNHRLEIEIGDFIERLFPVAKDAAQAARKFWDVVDNHVGALLNGNSIDMSDQIEEMSNADPGFTLELIQLWTRAIAARSQARLIERKINLGAILRERVRIAKALPKINAYRRRLI